LSDEFYQWADEAAKRLASNCGVFVERDASTTTSPNVAQYPVPAGFVDAIHVSADGRALRPTSVAELDALDSTWPVTTGVVQRYSMDAAGELTITLYRIPLDGESLAFVYHRFPADITAVASVINVASPIADYFRYAMLAEARRKQSEGAMPEMAAHFDERVALYEKVICSYWGSAG
jgi:hypothetical protein